VHYHDTNTQAKDNLTHVKNSPDDNCAASSTVVTKSVQKVFGLRVLSSTKVNAVATLVEGSERQFLKLMEDEVVYLLRPQASGMHALITLSLTLTLWYTNHAFYHYTGDNGDGTTLLLDTMYICLGRLARTNNPPRMHTLSSSLCVCSYFTEYTVHGQVHLSQEEYFQIYRSKFNSDEVAKAKYDSAIAGAGIIGEYRGKGARLANHMSNMESFALTTIDERSKAIKKDKKGKPGVKSMYIPFTCLTAVSADQGSITSQSGTRGRPMLLLLACQVTAHLCRCK
jgi:hypothetical protein